MYARKLALHFTMPFLFICFALGQSASISENVSGAGAPEPLKRGVVVESVTKNAEAEKAGLQEGDILLTWTRGAVRGEIESPFDLSQAETEQAPRGAVSFEGLRGVEHLVWVLRPPWGVIARPNFRGNLLVLYQEGQKLAKAGKPTKAADLWRVAAGEAQKSPASWLRSWFLSRGASLFANAKQWKETDDEYQETVQASAQEGPAIRGQLLFAWAQAFHWRSDWGNAEKLYQQAIAESRKSGAENLTAVILTCLGLIAKNRGDLANAAEYLRQALVIREKLEPDTTSVGISLVNLGIVAIDRGDLAQAEEFERRALVIFEQLTPRGNGLVMVLNNLGVVARERGDLASAQEFYSRALAIKQELAPESLEVAAILSNLGMVADLRGDVRAAEEYVGQSLIIRQKLAPGSLEESISLHNLGDVAQHGGQFTKSEEYYNRALEIEQKLAPEGPLVAATLNSLGDVTSKEPDLAKAESYYRRALGIREKAIPGSADHAETLASLARILRRNGRSDAAAKLFEQALDALESQAGRLGGSDEIRSDFRATHAGYYRDYIDLLMAQKQPELAFQVMERSRARTLLEMLAAAHVDVRKSVDPDLLDQERRLRDLLQGKINERLRLFSGQHSEKQIRDVASEIAGLLRQHEEIEERVRVNSPGYAALTQPQPLDAKAVQRLLPNDTLLLEYSLGESHSYVFAVTANSLNSYELPGSTEITGKATHLYQLLAERSRMVRTENDRQRHERLRKADAESRTAAVELSRMVLGSVAAELQQRRLLIVSDGALHYVPFAALPMPGLLSAKTQSPLILHHEIINLPSASVLAILRHEQRKSTALKEVALFADPVFDNRDSRVKMGPVHPVALTEADKQSRPRNVTLPTSDAGTMDDLTRSVADMSPGQPGEIHLPRLAFTRDEAKAILAVVSPGSGLEALGFDASRKLAMSGELTGYRVIHFATHALIDNIHPELSGLVLSLVDERGQPLDGFLELQDIYNLELSADLVVLSACQTALGKQIDGEGMIGLTRGFMYAGASHVVASLWKVDDFATAKLMAYFYKALEQKRMRPAEALRQAQVELWKEQPWSAPYYWAGFTLQGDWQ